MNMQKLATYLLAGLLCVLLWPTAAHAQSSTTTIRGTGLQPLVEESGSSQTLNIYGPGGAIIAQVATESPAGGTPTTQTRYLLHDHLGSTRVVLDSNNQVLGSFDYSPFGETTPTGNVADVAYRYTGQEVNGALGTYNYHARHYDAGVGRFLGVDPARQFASSYAYVGNNPINGVDPTGGIDIPVDAETFNQLGRASRAIAWAREQASYIGNNQPDIVATDAESRARVLEMHRIRGRYPPPPDRYEIALTWAASGAVACAGNCDELNGLTYAYLTFVEPDPTRPILLIKDQRRRHTFTLIGDPEERSRDQVVVADAWVARPQAARLSDTKWDVFKTRIKTFATAEVVKQHQGSFSTSKDQFGKDWEASTGVRAGTGYDELAPNAPKNFIGRRAQGITGANFEMLHSPGVYNEIYSTKRYTPHNYFAPDGSALYSRWHTVDLFRELPFAGE